MITTGLDKLDGFLQGGVPGGMILDIFGANGTGKTLLLLQMMASSVRDGGRVLYVDTTGGFRPERMLDICGAGTAAGLLENITVSRATNTAEQISSIHSISPGDLSMIAIDNVTDLFSFEYSRKEHTFEKNLLFMRHMRELAGIAASARIPVAVTNMIRRAGDEEAENMKSAMDPFTHVKIRLSGASPVFRCRAYWAMGSTSFSYTIGRAGLSDTQDF